jgi:hypothetical protein
MDMLKNWGFPDERERENEKRGQCQGQTGERNAKL